MPFDTFLVIPDVPGESAVDRLTDIHGRRVTTVPSELSSFGYGISNPVTIGTTRGRPTLSDFHVVKKYDKASVSLARLALNGKAVGAATVLVRRTAEVPVVVAQYDLSTVYVQSVRLAGDVASDEEPLEYVSLVGTLFRETCATQNPDGSRSLQTVLYDQAKGTVT